MIGVFRSYFQLHIIARASAAHEPGGSLPIFTS